MLGVMDRHVRHTWLEQLDPPPVHHVVLARGGDGYCPAEVVVDSDEEVHSADS